MSASDEVDSATGEAPERSAKGKRIDVGQLLNEKREALSAARERYAAAKAMRDEVAMGDETRLIDALKDLIPALETEFAGVLEETGREEAEHRLRGIKRAYGSLLAEYQDDEKRVEQAIAVLGEAITTLNGRARKIEGLRAESVALADRFELAIPLLAVVSEPQLNLNASLPPFWRLQAKRPSFESDEHGLRERRDFAEISGSVAYEIIQRAGLRPYRPLTEREREVLLADKDERPDPVLAAAAVEVAALGQLNMPAGHVHRG